MDELKKLVSTLELALEHEKSRVQAMEDQKRAGIPPPLTWRPSQIESLTLSLERARTALNLVQIRHAT